MNDSFAPKAFRKSSVNSPDMSILGLFDLPSDDTITPKNVDKFSTTKSVGSAAISTGLVTALLGYIVSLVDTQPHPKHYVVCLVLASVALGIGTVIAVLSIVLAIRKAKEGTPSAAEEQERLQSVHVNTLVYAAGQYLLTQTVAGQQPSLAVAIAAAPPAPAVAAVPATPYPLPTHSTVAAAAQLATALDHMREVFPNNEARWNRMSTHVQRLLNGDLGANNGILSGFNPATPLRGTAAAALTQEFNALGNISRVLTGPGGVVALNKAAQTATAGLALDSAFNLAAMAGAAPPNAPGDRVYPEGPLEALYVDFLRQPPRPSTAPTIDGCSIAINYTISGLHFLLAAIVLLLGGKFGFAVSSSDLANSGINGNATLAP